MLAPQRYIIGSLVIILAAFAIAIAVSNRKEVDMGAETREEAAVVVDCRDFSESELHLGDLTIPVAVAETKEEHAEGLSGCTAVPEGKGMYFTFNPRASATFWMKDMVTAIDIVWVREGKVVGIEEQVAPQPGVADADLTRYRHTQAIDGALELAAGQAGVMGIEIGDEVAF